MLQPSHCREHVERARRGNHWATERAVAANSAAEDIIEAIQQERLIIVHLNVRAKRSIRKRHSGFYIHQASLLRVDLDKRLRSPSDCRSATWVNQRNVFKSL